MGKESAMGSSKYEFEPELFEKDIQNKKQVVNFFKGDLERVLYKDYEYCDGSKMSNQAKREVLRKVHKEFLDRYFG